MREREELLPRSWCSATSGNWPFASPNELATTDEFTWGQVFLQPRNLCRANQRSPIWWAWSHSPVTCHEARYKPKGSTLTQTTCGLACKRLSTKSGVDIISQLCILFLRQGAGAHADYRRETSSSSVHLLRTKSVLIRVPPDFQSTRTRVRTNFTTKV
jgi:hypothetical protein